MGIETQGYGTDYGANYGASYGRTDTSSDESERWGSWTASSVTPAVERRVGNATEESARNGDFVWTSDDGHTVELGADGARITGADGSVHEHVPVGSNDRGPSWALASEPGDRSLPGDRSDIATDSDGNVHWTDGHGTHVELRTDGTALFARPDGSVRRHDGDRVFDALTPEPDALSPGESAPSFPLPYAGEEGSGWPAFTTFEGGGVEVTDNSGGAIRLDGDDRYRWTDGEGNHIDYDPKEGTLSMLSENGDFRTLGPDGVEDEGNVHGKKPSTPWPDLADVVDRDGDSVTVTNPSGSVARFDPQGNLEVRGIAGSSMYRDVASGEFVLVDPSGGWQLFDGSNNTLTGHLLLEGEPPVGQGVLEREGMAGYEIDRSPMPDGGTLIESSDGVKVSLNPDGSTDRLSPDSERDGIYNLVHTDPSTGAIEWRAANGAGGSTSIEEVGISFLGKGEERDPVAGADAGARGWTDDPDSLLAYFEPDALAEFGLTGDIVEADTGTDALSIWIYEDGGELLHYPDTGEITLISPERAYQSYDSVNDVVFARGRADDDFPVSDGMLDAEGLERNAGRAERGAGGDGFAYDS